MAITKAKKQDIIAKVDEALNGAESVVFARFNKLSVKDTSAMRKAMKEQGVGYYVAKKTLMRLALAKKGYTGEMPDLQGEIAMAWSTDATAPARVIFEHGKKHKGAIAIMGGVFEGAYADAEKMTAIATIPALPVLRGMFVNVINSPIQSLAIALDAIAKKKAA